MAIPVGLRKPHRILALLPVLIGLALELGAFAMTVESLGKSPDANQVASVQAPARSM
jgi:hypothetical protein